jgi:hypothetical protein
MTTPAMQEAERKNNRIFWTAVAILMGGFVLIMAFQMKPDTGRDTDELVRACAVRAVDRAHYQGRSPDDDELARIISDCTSANN